MREHVSSPAGKREGILHPFMQTGEVAFRKGARGSVLLLAFVLAASGAASAEPDMLEKCLQRQILIADEATTVGEIRRQCRQRLDLSQLQEAPSKAEDAVERRLTADSANALRPFTFLTYRQNYFLIAAHNFQGYSTDRYDGLFDFEGESVKSTEAQFQLSIKTPLATTLFDRDLDLYAGYTMRSFWQVYHTDVSSPFRETNHEPELWLQTHPRRSLFGGELTALRLGLSHQSNGQSGNLSRSWNRIYGDLIFTRGNFALSLQPWLRLEEDAEDDDNPDITDYLGHGSLRLAYSRKGHTFSLLSRNNIESGFSRGGVEIGWSFPFFRYPYLKGYLQYFSGYGESLIDYDRYVNRIGVGILFSDLL